MKRFLLTCVLLAWAVSASAQTIAGGSLTANGQSLSVSLRGARIENISVQVTGTWTGTLTFQGSLDGATFVSVLASNASSSAAPAATTTSNGVFMFANIGYQVVRVASTAAMTGTAVVSINQGFASSGPGSSGGGTSDATAANQTTEIGHLADIVTATESIATAAGVSTLERYISAGSTEDENEIKATAGVLDGISARNSHASTDAYLKCTNLTAANTTPGTSAIFYEMLIPHGGGFVDSSIIAVFDTALTCYIVTGKADNDVAEVGAGDVSYNIRYR